MCSPSCLQYLPYTKGTWNIKEGMVALERLQDSEDKSTCYLFFMHDKDTVLMNSQQYDFQNKICIATITIGMST